MAKLGKDIAEKEAMIWLGLTGKKEISQTDKAEPANFQILVESFMEGSLIIKDGTLKQTLQLPIGEKETIKELTFKSRITAREIARATASMLPGWDNRVIGYISELTNQPLTIAEDLSHLDYKVAGSVAYFFM